MFHMITLEQTFVNSPLQKKFLLLLLLNRIDRSKRSPLILGYLRKTSLLTLRQSVI